MLPEAMIYKCVIQSFVSISLGWVCKILSRKLKCSIFQGAEMGLLPFVNQWQERPQFSILTQNTPSNLKAKA